MRHKYNPQMIKRHLTYTAKDISRLYGICEETVLRWIAKEGLERVPGIRNPYLVSGAILAAFLRKRSAKSKTHLQPDELYCVKCRVARKGKQGTVGEKHTGTKMGNGKLMGIRTAECEVCGGQINRFFTYAIDEHTDIM